VIVLGGPNVEAELKEADDTDPSIIAYMEQGPIRFYLPTGDVDSLSTPIWRYRGCDYGIVDRRGTYGDDPFTGDLDWEVIVEARCKAPKSRAIYYFDERSGLHAVTVMNFDDAEAGRRTYFLIGSTTTNGFGARSDRPQ
jgi:hypothetical protein